MKREGSATERAIVERLVRRNTPSLARRTAYEAAGRAWVARVRRDGRGGLLHGATLRRSALFGGAYVCAYLADELFQRGAGHDASCAPAWPGFPHPLVLLPRGRARARSAGWRSIVEHEIVHANQGLTGRFPDLGHRDDAGEVIALVLAVATVEFEAHFLQLAAFPAMFPAHRRFGFRLTPATYAAARAWTEALTRLVGGNFCGERLVPVVLDALAVRLGPFLAEAGLPPADIAWFEADQVRLVAALAAASGRPTADAAARWARGAGMVRLAA